MGDFLGHALPGTLLMLISLWHTLQISVNYFRYKARGKPIFQSSTYFACPCGSKLPVESILKFGAAALGLVGEACMAYGNYGYLLPRNWQHMSMYLFFGLASFLEILSYYKFYLPDGIVYISYALSFSIMSLLFYWHLHAQQPLESQVHSLLLLLSAAIACSMLIEWKFGKNVLAALSRSYFMMLQGLWFWQVAFILYPPQSWEKWDGKSHEQMMTATIIFCAYVFAAFVVALAIWFAVACRYGLVRHAVVLDSKKEYLANDSSAIKNGFHQSKSEIVEFGHENEDEADALIRK